ncbi:MAG: nitronate monooxygenase, partial [Stenotrophomonas acidaminiphila]|nr:nitronate monooxygenase [Stenotrophomonas acidaminiphila]
MTPDIRQRVDRFCQRFGVGLPVLLAPMAGACPVALSAAVASAGGMGAMGAVLSTPAQIGQWMDDFRRQSHGP